eukprot:TRINITY_DN5410_c0_g5_i1.p2 TRINITY_DN5410_c0_g5~~TRINITY_DN5410_c0_g5_i1.p2  ORF type:complete len:260 (+),score=52.25 TRINITY_DN5410_c0_g5_i1:94-873(+)
MSSSPFMRSVRALFARSVGGYQNPWLAGRREVVISANVRSGRGLFRATPVARMAPQLGFLFQGALLAPMNIHLFNLVQYWIGMSYPIIPWLLLWGLVWYLLMYSNRVTDYDMGYTKCISMITPESDWFPALYCTVQFYAWQAWMKNWMRKEPGDGWVMDAEEGRVVEPGPTKVSPGGLAAYHICDGISLRHELIERRDRWCRNWVKQGHQLFMEPTWVFGATQDVHARQRTYIGDWCDEMYPWSRSSVAPSFWPTPIEY